MYRQKRADRYVKLYKKGEDGEPVSVDGPDKSKNGFPLLWKYPEGRSQVELKSDFLTKLREMRGRRAHAAEAIGLPVNTLYSWLQRDEGFKENVEAVEALIKDDKRRLSHDLAFAGDREFIKIELQTVPDYNPARQTKVEVSGTVQHDHAMLRDMTAEDRKKLFLDAADAIEADFEEITKD